MVKSVCTQEAFLIISQMQFSSLSQVHFGCKVHSVLITWGNSFSIPDCDTLNEFGGTRNEVRNQEDGKFFQNQTSLHMHLVSDSRHSRRF